MDIVVRVVVSDLRDVLVALCSAAPFLNLLLLVNTSMNNGQCDPTYLFKL